MIIGTILFVKELRQNPTFMMIVNLSVSDIVVSVVVDSSTIVGKENKRKRVQRHILLLI